MAQPQIGDRTAYTDDVLDLGYTAEHGTIVELDYNDNHVRVQWDRRGLIWTPVEWLSRIDA